MAKPSAAKQASDPSQQTGSGALLLVVVLLTVVAGGAGLLAGQLLKRTLIQSAASPSPVAEMKLAKSTGVQVVPLPSIVTNLAGQGGSWVRLEASVLVADDKPIPPALPAQLAGDVTALLRTLTLLQIAGASGFQHLREEIHDRMQTRSGGRVREVIIQSMIIE